MARPLLYMRLALLKSRRKRQPMKTMYLTSLMLLVGLAACSGGKTTEDPGGGKSRAQLKKAAADAVANGHAPASDVCAANDWYGDGECDPFCGDNDALDCAPDCGGGVICAAFIEEPNGYCSRRPDDPCINQDPDCIGRPPGGDEPPVECLIVPLHEEERDGACSLPEGDPCRYIDPDCEDKDDMLPPDDEQTPPGRNGPCPAIEERSDGVCSRPESDSCRDIDPDCRENTPPPRGQQPTPCFLIEEKSDGVCSRPESDPCRSNDPDCEFKDPFGLDLK